MESHNAKVYEWVSVNMWLWSNYSQSFVDNRYFPILLKIFPSIRQFLKGECDLKKLGTNTAARKSATMELIE